VAILIGWMSLMAMQRRRADRRSEPLISLPPLSLWAFALALAVFALAYSGQHAPQGSHDPVLAPTLTGESARQWTPPGAAPRGLRIGIPEDGRPQADGWGCSAGGCVSGAQSIQSLGY